MNRGLMDVTIVVVPRERFSFTQPSLESIYEHTPGLEHLVYVDGGSPMETYCYLAWEAAARGFLHVRSERYLSPNQARNIGLRHVRTPYVVFVDNDVLVEPGWLDALLACADETGAAIVGPLYQIDIAGHRSVHMAGGDAGIVEKNGKRVCLESHYHAGDDVALALARKPCDVVEFHAMLVRMDLLAATGPLDERLLSLNEHVDLCLIARERGASVYFEPKSVVTYVPATRLRTSDIPFFMLRWSERWNSATSKHFNAKWRLDATHPQNRDIVRFCRYHRQRGLRLLRANGAFSWPDKVRQRIAIVAERMLSLCLYRAAIHPMP